MTASDKQLPAKVAVIGAGISGLTCAAALKGLVDVTVFEKSVFVGGRISRYSFGEHQFNYGEQYFTVSNPLFLSIVKSWQTAGIIRPWEGWIVELDQGRIIHQTDAAQRFMGYPSMQAITDNLAQNLNLKLTTDIGEIEFNDHGEWRLFDERGGYLGMYDRLILAVSAHQVSNIPGVPESISEIADSIDMTVCWSAMFEFPHSLNLPFDAAFVMNSPVSWLSRFRRPNHSEDGQECWVIHASPEWSAKYVASFRGRVMHALLDAFFEACGINKINPVFSNVHCWKHATPINTLDQDCLYDDQLHIGACGDWCTSPRVEGAVLSGFSMADRLMKSLR